MVDSSRGKHWVLSDFLPRSVQVAITKYISPDSLEVMEFNWSEFERVKAPGKTLSHRVGEYSYRFAP